MLRISRGNTMNCCVASVIHKESINILMIASLIDSQLNIPMIKQRSLGRCFDFSGIEPSHPLTFWYIQRQWQVNQGRQRIGLAFTHFFEGSTWWTFSLRVNRWILPVSFSFLLFCKWLKKSNREISTLLVLVTAWPFISVPLSFAFWYRFLDLR